MGGGDGHPEMKASDRESNVDEWGRTGDGHPEMKASDRLLKLCSSWTNGDGHPEMKASDRDGSIDAVICEVLIS